MKNMQKTLDQADEKFKSMKPIEKIMVYSLILLIIGAVMYIYAIPMNSKKISALQNKTTTIEQTLKQSKNEVKNNEEIKIFLKEAERSNESIKEEIDNNEQASNYIDKKIEEQYNIKFSASQWGKFYKEIQIKSKKHKIKLSKIDNQNLPLVIPTGMTPEQKIKWEKENKKQFRPIFTITLEGTTRFKNLLDFLVDIEKNKLITKLDEMTITSNSPKDLKTSMKINLWGIK